MSVSEYLKSPNLARYPFVFIVTFGRSGSTLLQGILNSIPGYCMRGENEATLLHLFIAADKIAATSKKGREKTDPTDPLFGADLLEPAAFGQRLADIFLSSCLQPPEGTRCIGFKEVRHTPRYIPDRFFPSYLDFIQAVFPGAGLIFNIRNVNETLNSGWWAAGEREGSRVELDATIDRFTSYAATRSNCFVFSYDLLRENSDYCRDLFDFLGEPFDQNRLEEVLSRSHSYNAPHREDLQWSIEQKSAELSNAREELSNARKALSQTLRRVARLEASLEAMKNTASWKATSLFRRIKNLLIGRK